VSEGNNGFILETDDGTIETNIDRIREMAEEGEPDGLYGLGMAYLFGWGAEQDKEKGFKMLEAASEKGHPYAMTLLVSMFIRQEYVKLDIKKAVEYSMVGANAGISDAQLFLGTAYVDGAGVDRDYVKAAELFRMAAKQGNAEARNSLAFLYQEGLGVERDETKAFKLFKNAASAGSVNAQFQTGVCYETGSGVKKDLRKAAEWFGKAAEQGDSFAMERLGMIYSLGADGMAVQPELSFKWFLDAALLGMLGAMHCVGVCYIDGFGVEKDAEEGKKWLRLASSSGNETSKALLAEIEGGAGGFGA